MKYSRSSQSILMALIMLTVAVLLLVVAVNANAAGGWYTITNPLPGEENDGFVITLSEQNQIVVALYTHVEEDTGGFPPQVSPAPPSPDFNLEIGTPIWYVGAAQANLVVIGTEDIIANGNVSLVLDEVPGEPEVYKVGEFFLVLGNDGTAAIEIVRTQNGFFSAEYPLYREFELEQLVIPVILPLPVTP